MKRIHPLPINQQRLYFLARVIPFNIDFHLLNDRTYDQMKSSGNLRLIHDQSIADSISVYYFESKELSNTVNILLGRELTMLELQGKVFDGAVFQEMTKFNNFTFQVPTSPSALITNDQKIINELIVSTHYVSSITGFTKIYFEDLHSKARRLLIFLKKEYHLDQKINPK